MATYNRDSLLFQFWTSQLFHVQFWLLLLDLHTVSQKTSKVVWYAHHFKIFPQLVVIHTIKGFSVVTVAEVNVFLEFPCFLYKPMSVGNLISGSSAFSKSNLYIWKFLVQELLKPRLKDFEHYYLASMWNESNCMVVWTFFANCFSLQLEWKLTFPSPVATAEFSKFADLLSAALWQHYLFGLEIAQREFYHLH